MSGKIMQKSLILGALMAFVITGNVWAAAVENNSTNDQAIAIGAGAQAAATGVAIGRLSNAAAGSSVAIGVSNTASGNLSVAMGYHSEAQGNYSVAIGRDSVAVGANSVVIGTGSKSTDVNGGAVVIGSASESGYRGISIGDSAKSAGNAIAMGFKTNSTHTGNVAIGLYADALDESATAIGYNTDATGNRASAYGANAKASGLRSTALGYSAEASGAGDLAIGSHAITEAVTSVNTATVGGVTYNVAGNDADGFIAAASFGGGESSSLTGGEPIYRQLQKVAAGQVSSTSTDAVNGSQLYAAYQAVDNITAETNAAVAGLNQRLDRTNTRLDKVGAGAAALAALHPLEYDPDDKLTFSVGMGNYSGENAAALGAFYRPDEKLMFSLGGTMGNGENMVNVGVSIGLDKPNGFAKMSKRELIQEVTDVKAENEAMKAEMVEMKAMLQKLLAKN